MCCSSCSAAAVPHKQHAWNLPPAAAAAAAVRSVRRDTGFAAAAAGPEAGTPAPCPPAAAQAVAERFGVQGGGTNADAGATGKLKRVAQPCTRSCLLCHFQRLPAAPPIANLHHLPFVCLPAQAAVWQTP